MYPYMLLLEHDQRNFIEKMKEYYIISWNSDYPELCQRKPKLEESRYDYVDGSEALIEEYCTNPELLKRVSRSELILILDFLEKLIHNLVQQELNAVTLATNLLPECNKRLKHI